MRRETKASEMSDFLLPWEQPNQNENAGVAQENNPNPNPRARSGKRRSSILKVPNRAALQDLDPNSPQDNTNVTAKVPSKASRRSSKRVSFSANKMIKEFETGSQTLTIWNKTYEEENSHQNSTNGTISASNSSNEISNNITAIKRTLPTDEDVSPRKRQPLNLEVDTSPEANKDSRFLASNDEKEGDQTLIQHDFLKTLDQSKENNSFLDGLNDQHGAGNLNQSMFIGGEADSSMDMTLNQTKAMDMTTMASGAKTRSSDKPRATDKTMIFNKTGTDLLEMTCAGGHNSSLAVCETSGYKENSFLNMLSSGKKDDSLAASETSGYKDNSFLNMLSTGNAKEEEEEQVDVDGMELTMAVPNNKKASQVVPQDHSADQTMGMEMTMPVPKHKNILSPDMNQTVGMEFTMPVPKVQRTQSKKNTEPELDESLGMEMAGPVRRKPATAHVELDDQDGMELTIAVTRAEQVETKPSEDEVDCGMELTMQVPRETKIHETENIASDEPVGIQENEQAGGNTKNTETQDEADGMEFTMAAVPNQKLSPRESDLGDDDRTMGMEFTMPVSKVKKTEVQKDHTCGMELTMPVPKAKVQEPDETVVDQTCGMELTMPVSKLKARVQAEEESIDQETLTETQDEPMPENKTISEIKAPVEMPALSDGAPEPEKELKDSVYSSIAPSSQDRESNEEDEPAETMYVTKSVSRAFRQRMAEKRHQDSFKTSMLDGTEDGLRLLEKESDSVLIEASCVKESLLEPMNNLSTMSTKTKETAQEDATCRVEIQKSKPWCVVKYNESDEHEVLLKNYPLKAAKRQFQPELPDEMKDTLAEVQSHLDYCKNLEKFEVPAKRTRLEAPESTLTEEKTMDLPMPNDVVSVANYLAYKNENQTGYGRWQLKFETSTKASFSFLYDSMILNANYGLKLPPQVISNESGPDTVVNHFTLSSLGFENPSPLMKCANSDPVTKLAHWLLLKQLTPSKLNSWCNTTTKLEETLVKISSVIHDAAKFLVAADDIEQNHGEFFVPNNTQIHVAFHSTRKWNAFKLVVDFSSGFEGLKKSGGAKLVAKVGKMPEDSDFSQMVKSCSGDWRFLRDLVEKLDEWQRS